MPVHFIAAEGFDACKPHGGQTQESLLRALGGRVKCPGASQPLVPATRLRLHAGATAITLSVTRLHRMEAFPPEKSPCKAGHFSPANGSKPFDRHKLLE